MVEWFSSNPPPCYYLDLFSVVPSSTPRPRCINSQLVSLPPVKILISLCYIIIIFSIKVDNNNNNNNDDDNNDSDSENDDDDDDNSNLHCSIDFV